MTDVNRISAILTREKVSTEEALLVCIYDDTKFKSVHLEGAIPYSEFEIKLPDLPMDQEIIFY